MPSLSTKIPDRTERFSDDNRYVRGLIQQLETLRDGPAIVGELIRAGGAAVPILADALLNGNPRSIYQPRCLLVEALAGLRAHDVLIEYLRRRKSIVDPELEFAEDAVVNTAARELKSTMSAEAFSALLEIARVRALPGVIEALGVYRQPDSIQYLIRGLESDLAHAAAYDALCLVGQPAEQALLQEAFHREPPPPDFENCSSLHRRRACLRLLGELALSPEHRRQLLTLVRAEDPEIVMLVCKILASSETSTYRAMACQTLKSILPRLGWHLQDEARALLRELEPNR
ncbi:MAG: HEAT repeat domain-containing protein [Bryobacteraceae bacterium]